MVSIFAFLSLDKHLFLKLFHLYLGGGGVGKTFLINVVSKWAEHILRKEGTDPLDPTVLLLGPTGKSANLIGKFIETNTYVGDIFELEFNPSI